MAHRLKAGLFLFVILISSVYEADGGVIDPSLGDALLSAGPSDQISTIVVMKERFNVFNVWGNYVSVVNNLKSVADETQAELYGLLWNYKVAGKVSDIKRFWIINAVAVKATPDVIKEIAQRPDIDYITLEKTRWIPQPMISKEDIEAVGWNISKVRADEVWAMGYNGSGVVVANIDTGVDVNHPALASRYRGGTNSWFDAVNGQASPYDDHGHGTHTMGTIVGDDGSNQIGIAPGAQFIAAKACSSEGSCLDTWLLSAAQWAMDPDGNPATPDYPKVINNSWGGGNCDDWYRTVVTNWRAAGIFPSFSAGNAGPNGGTINSPGDYPESFAVGATDSNDSIAWFSSRGPSCWEPIKPEVTAPGVNIRSSIPGGGYQNWDGTSMAAPHVSGGVALLLQIDPDLTVDEIENVLKDTAIDLGVTGPDNNYGWGRIDLYKAAMSVIGLPPVSGPDLIVSQLTAPASATTGGKIYVDNSVTNQGDETAASSKVGFYLSTNNNPSIGPSDTFIGSRSVPMSTTPPCPWPWCRVTGGGTQASGLAPGETSTHKTQLTIPSGISAGTYYIKAKADYQEVVSETEEGNNIMTSGAITITKGGYCPPWWKKCS